MPDARKKGLLNLEPTTSFFLGLFILVLCVYYIINFEHCVTIKFTVTENTISDIKIKASCLTQVNNVVSSAEGSAFSLYTRLIKVPICLQFAC